MPQPQPAESRAAPAHRVLVGQIPDRLPTKQHAVALTFDAGADNAGAPKILAALALALDRFSESPSRIAAHTSAAGRKRRPS